ncbi:hypothetical protein ACHAXT_005411 [Thalassiosira profunda]
MARNRLIASTLGRAAATCACGKSRVAARRRPHLHSLRQGRHHVASSCTVSDAGNPAATPEGPLIRFDSAVIRYPPQSASDFEYGLDDDCNRLDGDLLLESQSSLEHHQREKQQHLQRHWNEQQSDPAQRHNSFAIDEMSIWPNLECGGGGGGHVVLGRNGSGKTLLSRSLVHSLGTAASKDAELPANATLDGDNPFFHAGSLSMNRRHISKNRSHKFLSHVSFDSHSDLLLDVNTTTVHRALIPSGGNRLSPTAKFLVVRLGMFPLLPRYVNTLSTGEIRRVLLVRALVSKPELLILDNAFDGLDVQGRYGLQDIIERVLKGFRMDVLVQGIDAKNTARTQVLLLTHRPEEIADGIGTITFIDKGHREDARARTEDRAGRSGEALVRSLESWEDQAEMSRHIDASDESETIHPWDIISDDDLPSEAAIKDYWQHGKASGDSNQTVLVHATNLAVTRDDTTLLSRLNWTVQRGERWHLAGTNGAGKSTLSRLLLRTSASDKQCNISKDAVISDGALDVISESNSGRGGIGWVSTELHLHASHNWGDRTAREILTLGASNLFNAEMNREGNSDSLSRQVELDIATTAARWLGLLDNVHCRNDSRITDHPFLSRKFSTLSQGEQKLLLVASAIAQRPSLLVLDEPCQGLDLWNRGLLLALAERICEVTDLSLIYITHHEEELIPAIRYTLRLDDGQSTYCGERDK